MFLYPEIVTIATTLKALARDLSEVGAGAQPHVRGVNNMFLNEFGISFLLG